MVRIAIIGAGSVEFTRNVVADLCSFAELEGALTIVLHDIDAERLAYAERAAASIVRRTGAGYRVKDSAERRPAVEGADYVINEIQVGGYRATLADFEIPKKYGLRQTIADTIGIGGIFRGLRTIPVMLGIGNDLHELAPGALLLNYANPMAMLPWAVYEGTPFSNVVGVCHSVRDTHAFLARTGLGDGCGWKSSGASATSRLNPVSTRASMCPGSCITTGRLNDSGARSTNTCAAAKRTSGSGSVQRRPWTPARNSRSSRPPSSPPRSSTRSRPAPSVRFTRTCETAD